MKINIVMYHHVNTYVANKARHLLYLDGIFIFSVSRLYFLLPKSA